MVAQGWIHRRGRGRSGQRSNSKRSPLLCEEMRLKCLVGCGTALKAVQMNAEVRDGPLMKTWPKYLQQERIPWPALDRGVSRIQSARPEK